MMRKRILTATAALMMAAVMAIGSATPAFAYADPGEDDPVVVVEENIEETPAEETEPETAEIPEDTGALTPDGNLTLVDDLAEDSSSGLQFMTVTTKDGHYFYIVIDRSGSSDNVYFLNTVDETDLMALMTDEEKEQFTSQEEDTASTPVVTVNEDTTGQTADTETETQSAETTTEKKADFSSSLVMLGVFLVIGSAIVAAYYFIKIGKAHDRRREEEDREFYDDDEYVNEDEEPEDEEED